MIPPDIEPSSSSAAPELPPAESGPPALEPPPLTQSQPSIDAPPPPVMHTITFECYARGGEYFRIWIVNLLLSVVTLGIYSAWAKVRRLRYVYGNTSLDGSRFEYHGQPIAILKGRVLAVGAYVLFTVMSQLSPFLALAMVGLFLAALPWIVVRALMFQCYMTAWRGLRFRFAATYGQSFRSQVFWPVLSIFTFGLAFPWVIWNSFRFQVTSTSYGSQPLEFRTTPWQVYRPFLVAALLVAAGIAGIVLLVGSTGSDVDFADYAQAHPLPLASAIGVGLTSVLVTVVYLQVSLSNALLSGVVVGPHRLVSSQRLLPMLSIVVTNTVLTILTLGLYLPWANTRLLRYRLEHLQVQATGDLQAFTAAASTAPGALGDAVGDIFDVDLSFGF